MDEYDIKKIFEDIELELIKSMKRTLWYHQEDEKAKEFKWPQWQALKLKQMKDYRKANKEIFEKYKEPINMWSKIQMKKQFKEGAKRTTRKAIKAGKINSKDVELGGSFFGLNHRKLDALIKSINSDLKDVKFATLRMASDQYRQILYKAQVYANTGAGTVKQAIDMATKDFLAKGFDCIYYENGRKVNIADYCDMAVRTANKRANLMGEGEMRKKLGNPLVYISKHGGACDKCTPWEGRVYIDDVWSGGKSEDGKYPLLSTAIAGGLFHPRCQHGSSTYYEDVNEKPEEIKENEHNKNDEYIQELQRRKKQYERLAVGSLFQSNIEQYQSKISDLQNRINGGTIKELTFEEETQLEEYTRFDATRINRAIRMNEINDAIQQKINILDGALSKTKPLEEDIILHRGGIIQNFKGFENKKSVSAEEILKLKDNIITDRAFISTSKSKAETKGRDVIMQIKVPKGFKGVLNLEKYAVPKYRYQKEVLLKRETQFLIKDIQQKDGKYYLDMEVVDNGGFNG